MGRVLKELRRVRKAADTDAVHDLRVAIRRCRSVAAIMEEVDAHPGWQEMRKLPRKLFRTLGDLRDLQVLEQWVKRLASEDDPLRPRLLEALEARQAKPRERVVGVADAFDRDAWRRLVHTVTRRARLAPPNSLTAKCLVIERYIALRALHARAVRTTSQRPWHALRIGLKRFRYAVESLLPGRSAVWDEGLSQMQGLLGGIHDLDVTSRLLGSHHLKHERILDPHLDELKQTYSEPDDEQFRSHWQSNYAGAGTSYDDYAPAYQYGYTMARNDTYRGRQWDDAETGLRSVWERQHPGSAWENFKAAVRHGWDRMTS
jgi:CHAD domain-containing protein